MAPVGSLRASVVAAAVVVTFVGTPAAAQDPLPAFPGAQGFGAVATGGRAGDVVIVDTLEPYGPGSLGAALDPEDCGPRIVVFRVSGVIEGELDLTCGDLTIAGQTAPGAGITVRGRIDGYGADPGGNLVIRHLRVRSGPPRPGTESFHDAIQLSNNPVAILDHVTASWSVDETVDVFEGTSNVTIQWSTIEESRIDPANPHNYGVIFGPGVANVSVHHSLFAHHRSRTPAIASGPAEVLNNVNYDVWDGFVHHNPADGEFHLVGNVYVRGQSESHVPFYFDDEDPGGTAYYLEDNLIADPGVFEETVDRPWGLAYEGFEDIPGEEFAVDAPTDFGATFPVAVQPSSEVLEAVLASAGAWPRDGVTTRTIAEVRDGTGGWDAREPADLLAGLTPGDPPPDADADGMDDRWEAQRGLDPADGDDHARVLDGGYTAIEVYVNELADQLVGGPSAPAADPAPPGAGPRPAAEPDARASAARPGLDTLQALAFAAGGAAIALGGVLVGRGLRRRPDTRER